MCARDRTSGAALAGLRKRTENGHPYYYIINVYTILLLSSTGLRLNVLNIINVYYNIVSKTTRLAVASNGKNARGGETRVVMASVCGCVRASKSMLHRRTKRACGCARVCVSRARLHTRDPYGCV